MSQPEYAWAGARALVTLHERSLREFLEVWRRADAADLALPETDDPSYASREILLVHVMACAAGYLTWICKNLELPSPALEARPEVEGFPARVDDYLQAVLTAWDTSLRTVRFEQSDEQTFLSRWGVPYSVDAMLEHAVMHPIRHSLQLQNLMA
jgi:uncharacterized damage-inducible protein DinB